MTPGDAIAQPALGTQLGPYRVEAALGAGGMGMVYRAVDTRLGRNVAIKVPKSPFDPRFEREARSVAALNHPNICTLFDAGPNYLVMELVEGPTLAARIARGPLPFAEAMSIARQIAEALDAAHEAGIVHRDLKPGNIKIKPDGTVKILDFGLARLLHPSLNATSGDDTRTVTVTEEGSRIGTPAYMAPEQTLGQPVDKRADIWAFGVVVYEVLTGARPFDGTTTTALVQAVLTREPDWDRVPPAPRAMLRRCLEKNPKHRLRDIGDLSWDTPAPAPLPRSRRWWIAVAAALAICGFSVWFTFFHLTAPSSAGRIFSFHIDPPENGHFGRGTNVTGLALSPDGKTAVFVASANGKVGLWSRPLDGTAPKFLPGTEGAGHPFWSPDGASIGFFIGGKLQRVDANGGAPQPIGETDTARGGSWSETGVILFGRGSSGIWQVPASGGQTKPLTTPNASRGEMFHYWPQALPGGHFLYFARSTKPENTGVYAASLARPNEPVQVLNIDASAWYAPAPGASRNGYLLWLRGETLLAQPFDPDALRFTGEARAIASPVARYGVSGQMYLTASANGILLYGSSYALNQFTWVDAAGHQLGTLGEPWNIGPFALTRDGRRVAFAMPNSTGTDIWLLETGRGVATRFTARPGQSIDPVWSADGRTLFFSSGPPFRMFRKDTSSAAEQLVTSDAIIHTPLDMSPDGHFLLYQDASQGHNMGSLWIRPTTGAGAGKPYHQTEFSEDNGRFSPDGCWIAYQCNESGRQEIYIDSFPDPRGKIRISTGGGRFPQWGASARELYYVSADNILMSVALRPEAQSLVPSAPRTLFPLGPNDGGLNPYVADPARERFLVNRWIENKPPLTVIVNWPVLLTRPPKPE